MKPNDQLIRMLCELFAVQSPELNKKKVIRVMLNSHGRLTANSAEQAFRRLMRCRIIELDRGRRLAINKPRILQWFDTHNLRPALFRIGF